METAAALATRRADPAATRAALLRAGLGNFGARGLDGASTRDIAGTAGAPMSAITYHFGGKEGLYLACAQHIADTMGSMITAHRTTADQPVREALDAIFSQLCRAILRDETAAFARFIMREQTEPTAAFAIIYGGVMGQVIERIAELLSQLSKDPLSPLEAKIRTIALMGQVIAFRVARATLMRATGWNQIGANEVEMIETVVRDHLDAVCDRLQGEARA